MTQNWIAVASADHVRQGVDQGFMQVCHGKSSPLRRVKPGDRVAYYSPTIEFGGRSKLQAFTAIGVVKAGDIYQFDMGGGFSPFRRDVSWLSAQKLPIHRLLDVLEFSSVSDHDMQVIATDMQADLTRMGLAP